MSDKANHKLTGSWQGKYFYPNGATPCGFEAVFIEQGGAVQGSILDSGSLGEANVTGSFRYPSLSFQKSYYNSQLNKVTYRGTMSDDGKKLSGTWKISGGINEDSQESSRTWRISFGMSGTWVASRQDGEELFEKIETEESRQDEREGSRIMVETA